MNVNRHTVMFFIVLFSLLIAVNISCAGTEAPPPSEPRQQPPPSPPTSQPPSPPPESSDGWIANGIISSGEYTRSSTYGNFELHWSGDEQYIYIGMKAKTSGWISLGIQPGSAMKDADMILGLVKDGQVEVYDQFSTGTYGPHPDDTSLGGTDDIVEFGGKEEGGFTVIEFRRNIDTGDKYDLPLSGGVHKVIWAYGSKDDSKAKHSSRGYGEIEL